MRCEVLEIVVNRMLYKISEKINTKNIVIYVLAVLMILTMVSPQAYAAKKVKVKILPPFSSV